MRIVNTYFFTKIECKSKMDNSTRKAHIYAQFIVHTECTCMYVFRTNAGF